MAVFDRVTTQRKADRAILARERGTHVENGWPHYSSTTGMCICLDQCCNNEKGCKCKFCPCHVTGLDHSELLSILGNTISSIGEDGDMNRILEVPANGGQSNNG